MRDRQFARDFFDRLGPIARQDFDRVALAREAGDDFARVGARRLADREDDGALGPRKAISEASGHRAATSAASASALQ